MTKLNQAPKSNYKRGVIEAAGGVVVKLSGDVRRIALIHRPSYDDWTLPKGGLEEGESWPAAAQREVNEETNCKVKVGNFVGCTCYQVGGIPKIVLYWQMNLIEERKFDPTGETDQLIWLDTKEASTKLTYRDDRQLLELWERKAD